MIQGGQAAELAENVGRKMKATHDEQCVPHVSPYIFCQLFDSSIGIEQRLEVGIAFGVGASVGPRDEFSGAGLDAYCDAAVLASDQAAGREFFQTVALAQRGGVSRVREEE